MDEDAARLRELVNDERARRTNAEREVARQKAEVSEWRQRARRAERLARFSLRLPDRRAPDETSPKRGPAIAYPAVRAGSLGAPEWVGNLVETVPIESLDEAGIAVLDIVVVGGETTTPAFEAWLEWPARQPLVAFTSSGALAATLAGHPPDAWIGDEIHAPLRPPTPGLASGEVGRRLDRAGTESARVMGRRLLAAAGVDAHVTGADLTAVAVTKRPDRVGGLIDTLASMEYSALSVVVATHGFEAGSDERNTAETKLDAVEFMTLPEDWPLGRCLNHALDRVPTPLWAKIDDDDFYGPRYLTEAWVEMEASGSDVVGKQTHYLLDESADCTYLLHPGNEHRFTSYVPGPTFVARRSVWEKVPFAHRRARVDSTFIRGVAALDIAMYSTSRFEFALGRRDAGHTWHADATLFAARGRKVGDGFARDEIFLPALDSPPFESSG